MIQRVSRPRLGGTVYYPAPFLFHHQRHGVAHGIEISFGFNQRNVVPEFFRHFPDIAETERSRHVDQNIYPAEVFDGGSDQLSGSLEIRDITVERHGFAAEFIDGCRRAFCVSPVLFRQVVQPVFLLRGQGFVEFLSQVDPPCSAAYPVIGDYFRAFFSQRYGNTAPDSLS